MKITSVLSLFAALAIMLYASVGQVGGIYMNIGVAKQEAAQEIVKGELGSLSISLADLSTGKASFTGKKELLYNGRLYDISAMQRHGDTWTLKVFHDAKEEGLLSNLKEIVEGWMNSPLHSGKQPSAKQTFAIPDFIPAGKFAFYYNDNLQQVFSTSLSYPSGAPLLSVLKSPPKFA